MTFHQIFPDIVYKTKIADSEIIKKKFANKIIDKYLHDPNQKAEWADLCNSWQNAPNKEVKNLFFVYFEKHVLEWFRYHNFPNIRYEVDMWINVHTCDMYQEVHNHIGYNTILCGVYNLQLNKKDRPLTFFKPNTYLDNVSAILPTIKNVLDEDVDAAEGDLLLFAPTQYHRAPSAREKHSGHRITLTFNVRSS